MCSQNLQPLSILGVTHVPNTTWRFNLFLLQLIHNYVPLEKTLNIDAPLILTEEFMTHVYRFCWQWNLMLKISNKCILWRLIHNFVDIISFWDLLVVTSRHSWQSLLQQIMMLLLRCAFMSQGRILLSFIAI